MKQIAFLSACAAAILLAIFVHNSGNARGAKDAANQDHSRPWLKPVGSSPEFPNAQLAIKSVTAEKAGNDSATVTFNFDVKNYELKMQTTDMGNKMCSNSAQGQHIHFIMDNQPYKALYEPANKITLANNSEHYLMVFLSRSYHESVKSKGAAVLYHFKIDANGNVVKLANPTTPMLFYSRPKGDYIGKDTSNVLLDFYVWNCKLSANGYKVMAHITNESRGAAYDANLTISDWKANFIQNLGLGKSHITLTLVDKNGKTVKGPSSTVTRNVTLSAGEPLK